MDDRTPLASSAASYYGKNDFRPYSCGKLICLTIIAIILSPLLLLYTIFAIILMCFCCSKMSPGQIGMAKVKTIDNFWFKAPGKRLEIRPAGVGVSEIIISPKGLVDSEGSLHTCGGMGFSLRKSIECTVEANLREGPYGARISEDTDVSKPRYHLHGQMWPYDPGFGDELWTASARFGQWASVYAWSSLLPGGWGLSGKVPLESAPEVLGYIILFELSNPTFFDGGSRIVRVGQAAALCPAITPENEGKLFARYGYRDTHYFGNIPTDGSEPDAFIFKGKTLENAQMKVLHTYRLMKPKVGGTNSAIELAENA